VHFQLNDLGEVYRRAWAKAVKYPADECLERFTADGMAELDPLDVPPGVHGYLKGDGYVYVGDQIHVLLGGGTPFTEPQENGGDETVGDLGCDICAYFLGRWWQFRGMSRDIGDELELVGR